MIRIFDTHAHYDDEVFDADRDSLFADFSKQGVKKIVNIATDIPSSEEVLKMVQNYEMLYGVIGIYPTSTGGLDMTPVFTRLKELAGASEKIVAIGEIGLDYHYDDTDKQLQQTWFASQMELARELSLPIVIHSRDAARDTITQMRESHAEEIGGVIHCYSYTKESAREFLDMDFFFGIGGVLTFKNSKKLKEAVEYIPLDHIVLETDAPYLAPEPFRGRRNESSYLSYVAEAIAQIKQIPVEKVYEATWDNAHRLYRIPRI
ncbi:MAG: TatD family hydrolase [Wujia sp.]